MSSHTSSKPSDHVCPDCGRAYKAAETMNRHRKNHSETSQYVCSVCTASFKRKDLLDRHSQIHIGGRQTTSRNRSQRACDRCSRLKTRCDNANPCTRCTKGGHECTYKHARTRARIDRSSICSSSASVSSSVHSSPHTQPTELHSVVKEPVTFPEPGLQHSREPEYITNSEWPQELWVSEPAWQWTQDLNVSPDVDLLRANDKPSPPQHSTPSTYNADVSVLLDPSLRSSSQYPSPVSTEDLFDNTPNDPSRPQTQFLPVGTARFDASASDFSDTPSHSGSDQRHPSPETCHADILKAQQLHIIAELAQFSTTAFDSGAKCPSGRLRYWQQSAAQVERAFQLEGLAPAGSHVLHQFHILFFQYFNAAWVIQDCRTALSCPPHLYLTMAAIGAAFAGTNAKSFHTRMLDILRPKLMLAALERQLSDEATLPLVQSLALLQAAMIHFGDHKALSAAPQLASVVVSLCRRIQLFDDAKFAQAQSYLGSGFNCADHDTRKRLAAGVIRLDAQYAQLYSSLPLLTEEERNACTNATDKAALDIFGTSWWPTNRAGILSEFGG